MPNNNANIGVKKNEMKKYFQKDILLVFLIITLLKIIDTNVCKAIPKIKNIEKFIYLMF